MAPQRSEVSLLTRTRDARTGNPSALELLFVPASGAIARTWPWGELEAMRDVFVTGVAFEQYAVTHP